jgi:hypothetical protein
MNAPPARHRPHLRAPNYGGHGGDGRAHLGLPDALGRMELGTSATPSVHRAPARGQTAGIS